GVRSSEGQEIYRSGIRHTRERAYSFQGPFKEINSFLIGVVFAHRQIHTHCQQILCVEPGVNRLQALETPYEQTRAHQQHKRECDFYSHEQVSQSVAARAATDVLATLHERFVQIEVRWLERGHHSKNYSGQERDRESECEYRSINLYLLQLTQFTRTQRSKQLCAPPREQQSCNAAGHRQQNAFSQQLSD